MVSVSGFGWDHIFKNDFTKHGSRKESYNVICTFVPASLGAEIVGSKCARSLVRNFQPVASLGTCHITISICSAQVRAARSVQW